MEDVVLVINPGSTSTKIAIYNRKGPLYDANIQHPAEDLQKFDKVTEQYELRLDAIQDAFNKNGMNDYKVVGIAGRGAPTKPLVGGTYEVNQRMLDDLRSCKFANHASNVGAIIAEELPKKHRERADITKPIPNDEVIGG